MNKRKVVKDKPQKWSAFEPKTVISVHRDIRYHPDLTFGERFFLSEISALGRNSSCPFSSRMLSEQFSVSHQTIFNWIKKLVSLDLLEAGIDLKNKDCKQFIKSTFKIQV